MNIFEFYKGKKVFLTGHTGFKGSYMTYMLLKMGADVSGYALENTDEQSVFKDLKLSKSMNSIIADIRDYDTLEKHMQIFKPDIVLHLAAQPLVIESYKNPRYTYDVNVMGTVNILDVVRNIDTVKSFVNVTTDKVYENKEWIWGYRENENLDGYDPYSNSKSCSELVTASYVRSFDNLPPVSTLRAGNVIGGGDYSKDRIIPDCVKSATKNEKIIIRNPHSIRPYQHVIEPIYAYLYVASMQMQDSKLSGSYNIGPDEKDCVSTKELVEIFCQSWGKNASYDLLNKKTDFHEAQFLRLDSFKIKKIFGLYPCWDIRKAVEKTVQYEKSKHEEMSLSMVLDEQIEEYMSIAEYR